MNAMNTSAAIGAVIKREERGLQIATADSYELPNSVLSSMPNPLVSVRTSTYNHGPYIRQCIESVLSQQTAFAFEYIIGEDCSTDETRQTVLEYAGRYPDRIRVITSDRNVGCAANGYRTRLACRGKYVTQCEGDDFWTDPLKLQKQVAMLESNPRAVLVGHRAFRIDATGRVLNAFPCEQPLVVRPKDIIMSGGSFCATNSMLMRRTLLLDLPKWFYAFPAGDSAMLNLAIHRGEVLFSNDIMSAYRTLVKGSYSDVRYGNLRIALETIRSTRKACVQVMKNEGKYLWHYRQRRARLLWLCVRLLLAFYLKRPFVSLWMKQSYKAVERAS